MASSSPLSVATIRVLAVGAESHQSRGAHRSGRLLVPWPTRCCVRSRPNLLCPAPAGAGGARGSALGRQHGIKLTLRASRGFDVRSAMSQSSPRARHARSAPGIWISAPRNQGRAARPICCAGSGPASTAFPGIVGFDDTVLPELEGAILAGHDLVLLGERGQGKTRLMRTAGRPARRVEPRGRRLRDPRRPVRAGLRPLPGAGRRARRRPADQLAAPRRPLHREAGHARTPRSAT